jgi:ATP-dependent 26S proteasome regulatory subunit
MTKENGNQTAAEFYEELSTLVRARYALIYLHTYEEFRAVEVFQKMSQERGSELYVWSRTQGVQCNGVIVASITDPAGVLKWYEELKNRSLLVLKDFHPFFKEPTVVRKLRDLSQCLKHLPKNIILLSPVLQVPAELNKDLTVLEMPLPTRDEIGVMVGRATAVVPAEKQLNSEEVDALTDAFAGLTHDEIENVLAKSLVSRGRLDKSLIHSEKEQLVKKSGVLEFIRPKGEVPQVGGLDRLQGWLDQRREGFTSAARLAGLPLPKGILMVGLPGCGKSLTATTVSRQWDLPLLRLDLGRVFSGLVGSSENNIREAIKTAEAVAPCILWLDEIEKGLSGSRAGGSSDGGTSSRVFGTVLTWLQEKRSSVFVVATANDISQLPPEFLRKGRFDEIFFVDLPHSRERAEILKIHLNRQEGTVEDLDLELLVQKTEHFSGAELQQVLIDAKYKAFVERVNLAQKHLLLAIEETVPLSRTMKDRIDEVRRWAIDRARPASSGVVSLAGPSFLTRTHSLELSSTPSQKAGS